MISDAYQSTNPRTCWGRSRHYLRVVLRWKMSSPLSFTVQQNDDAPNRCRELFSAIREWNELGAHARAQVAVQPIGVLIRLTPSANPLIFCPTFRETRAGPTPQFASPNCASPKYTNVCSRKKGPRNLEGFPGLYPPWVHPDASVDRPDQLRADAGRARYSVAQSRRRAGPRTTRSLSICCSPTTEQRLATSADELRQRKPRQRFTK